jgi:putative copper export protein
VVHAGALHHAAAGLWLGGLVPLGWLLRRARTAQDDAGIIVTRDAIRHFSQMGYVAVALIALTGTINTLLLVGSLGAMFGTPYGRLLALKILLFLAMVAVALINRFRLLPRLCREPQPSAPIAALARSVLFEHAMASFSHHRVGKGHWTSVKSRGVSPEPLRADRHGGPANSS